MRTTGILVALGLALLVGALAFVAVRDEPSSAREPILLKADGCLNPTLEFDSSKWITQDVVPRDWKVRFPLEGTFDVDGDSAIFRGPDGIQLGYLRLTDFEPLVCRL